MADHVEKMRKRKWKEKPLIAHHLGLIEISYTFFQVKFAVLLQSG